MSKESQTKSSEDLDFELPKSLAERIEKVVKEKHLNEEQRKKLEKEVKRYFENSKFEPGEVVGILAAQSISEPATQMSLEYGERILVKNEGRITPVEIGRFVDGLIEKFGYVEENGSEILDLPEGMKFFVYSLDRSEELKLKRIKSVVRHKSPKKLLRIKTASGREITATDHHSFVIRSANQIMPISGKVLRVGDRVPAMKFLPENCISDIQMSSILISENLTKVGSNVYPYVAHSKGLPDRLHLDYSLGWFIGAYLSEGNCSKYFVNISNTNEAFNQNVRDFASRFQLTVNEYDNFRGFSKGHDLHINSSLLSKFLKKTCGTNSKNKKVPPFAFSAKEEFVRALLQSYFDGDGSIALGRKGIRISSESKELIDGIALLLLRFKIFASKSNDGHWLWIPYKYSGAFLEKIGSSLKERTAMLRKLSSKYKSAVKTAEYTDMIPGVGNLLLDVAKRLKFPTRYVNNFTKRQRIGRKTLEKYLERFKEIARIKNVDISKELEVLTRALNSDVVWDRIESISYVDSDKECVYDISVDGLETFTTFDGIVTHNTMRTYHFAGSAGMRVTYGLPRLIEIFDAKKSPEVPVMTIYLKKAFDNRDTARKVAEDVIEKPVAYVSRKISINLTEGSIEIEPIDMKRVNTIANKIKEFSKDAKIKIKQKGIDVVFKAGADVKELQKFKEKIMDLHVDGIKGIANAIVRREGENWIINTIGSNLEQVLLVEEVDETRTISNDIHEVSSVLGIEAARNLIIDDAMKTMQEQGLDVDIRHVMLVGDIMTFTGGIKSIGRYGVAGAKRSILARAAFEETIKHLVRASLRNEVDYFQGIFENVMIGQVIPSGTGMFDLIAKFEAEEKEKEGN